MDKDVLLWLIGIICSILIVAIGWLAKFCFTINTRVTAMETYMKVVLKGASEVLHNDDTPKLDALLEKLVRAYDDKDCRLSLTEWQELQRLTRQLKNDLNRDPGKRLAANLVNSLATLVNDMTTKRIVRCLTP